MCPDVGGGVVFLVGCFGSRWWLLAVASPLVRRMVSARARPVVLLLTLLGGFLGTLVCWSGARAILSRSAPS